MTWNLDTKIEGFNLESFDIKDHCGLKAGVVIRTTINGSRKTAVINKPRYNVTLGDIEEVINQFKALRDVPIGGWGNYEIRTNQ